VRAVRSIGGFSSRRGQTTPHVAHLGRLLHETTEKRPVIAPEHAFLRPWTSGELYKAAQIMSMRCAFRFDTGGCGSGVTDGCRMRFSIPAASGRRNFTDSPRFAHAYVNVATPPAASTLSAAELQPGMEKQEVVQMKLLDGHRGWSCIVGSSMLAVALGAGAAHAQLTPVANANPKMVGFTAANVLSPELVEVVVAQGSAPLENGTAQFPYYGYDGNGPHLPPLGSNVEATKTEPDKNTYLVFDRGLSGPDPSYDYGAHFLFQGHENGVPVALPGAPAGTTVNGSYVTRINLDADGPHSVTLLATQTDAGAPLQKIDGSSWDPFARKLLFTTETAFATVPSGQPAQPSASIYQATPDFPSSVQDISNVIGRAGFEGVQNDDRGNLYLIEDVGGANGSGGNARTKQPNSFFYRFKPNDPANLQGGGTLQALQLIVRGSPLKFTQPASSSAADVAAAADADISGANSAGYVALHQYRTTLPTKWIDISTTTASTPLPGADDNALAKAAGATPFKRPENLAFPPPLPLQGDLLRRDRRHRQPHLRGRWPRAQSQPARVHDAERHGGFTTVFKLIQSPSGNAGSISVLYNGDQAHAGFDNVAFLSQDQIAFVEDAGDTLHTQRNALDSAYVLDVTKDYSHGAQPVRFIAEGRDAAATVDSGLSGSTGFQNDGDNEITGLYVSDGDTSEQGLLGEASPKLLKDGGSWRAFWTQQHGENPTYELIAAPTGDDSHGRDD
jgi:hypothetical protein